MTKYHKWVKESEVLFIYQNLYLDNQAILKSYAGKKFKLTYFKQGLKQKGFEKANKRVIGVNEEKLDVNISRARTKVFEYAYCNDWNYFITLTIDPNKYDRKNLKMYYKDFSQWLKNYQKKHDIKLQYLLIPELHSDGQSWHMHGFITGIPPNQISEFEALKHPQKLIDKGYMNWLEYSHKFGFVSLDKVRSREAAAKYVTKYINKSLKNSIKGLGAHLYYCSKGLKVAKEIKRGTLCNSVPFEFENEYVKIAWSHDANSMIKLFDDSMIT